MGSGAGAEQPERGARPARRARARPPRRSSPARFRADGHDLHLLRALRLPRARTVAGRAGAEDLLVQLAARRLRALHGAGRADGDRPRADRARSGAVDQRRGARAVGGELFELLRAGDRGDRRALRRRSRRAVGGPAGGDARPVLERDRRTAGDHLSQPLRAHSAPTRRASRGSSRAWSAATARPDSEGTKEKIEQFMSLRACPVCGGARLRAESRAVLVGGTPIDEFCALSARRALEWLEEVELSETDRHVARLILREISRAAAVPGERRDRLPVDGPRLRDAVRGRGAADPAGDADRQLARRRAVHPRRALDRVAPAR